MISGDIAGAMPVPSAIISDFVPSRVRDAVLVFRPSPATLRDLVHSGSAPAELAVLCAHDSLPELRELVRQVGSEGSAQSIVFFHGGILELLRSFPLRWRFALIEGPAADVSARQLTELSQQLAWDGSLAWLGPDRVAESLLDALVATGAVRADAVQAAGFRVLQAKDRLPRSGASPRPAGWNRLRALLIERDYLNNRSNDDPALTIALRALREECLASDSATKAGYGRWPYNVPTPHVAIPPGLPNGQPWPRISIVTPSFNQGRFIEETILSVLGQGYPNLEYLVIDGGSTDQTMSIVERYCDRIDHVVSEKDEGQSHAINKGMALATGEILTWLNSDDMLAPGALFAMAIAFATSQADMVAGIVEIYRDGVLVAEHVTACSDGTLPLDDILDLDCGWNAGQFFYQPEVFFTRKLWRAAGGSVDQSLFYSMDYELWLRFAEQKAQIHVIGRPIAHFRQHDDQKTSVESKFKRELESVRQLYLERSGRQPVPSRRALPDFSRRLRIALLNDHGWHWGAGIAHSRLAEAMRRAGCDVSAIAFRDGNLSSTGEQAYDPNSLTEAIAALSPDIVLLGNVHGAKIEPFVLKEIYERWPSLVVLHDFWWITGRCAYPGTCEQYKTGCSASCPTPEEYPQLAPERIAGAWQAKRLLLNSAHAPVLLGQSAWAVKMARSAFQESNPPPIEQISLGFPLDCYRPRNRSECREILGLPQDRFIVLFSASSITDKRKGAYHLKSIVRNLRLPGLLFVAVGNGRAEDLDISDENFKALGYVGSPERMALIYSAADVVVAPSSEETFGQIFVEAIACGTPAIGHGLTGAVDALLDGVTGLATLAPTAESLEEAIMPFYRDRAYRDAMSFWGRFHAENEWSIEACGQRFYATLRRLGIVDDLGLSHKVGFRRDSPELEPVLDLYQPTNTWRPIQGVMGREGPYPEYGLPVPFHWCLGPKAEIEVVVERPGRYLVFFDCVNRMFESQALTISMDGIPVVEVVLPCRTSGAGNLIDAIIEFRHIKNRLEMSFEKWLEPHPGEKRPLAMLLHSISSIALP